MIYGCINNFKDKNISKLRTLMRFTPILLLPKNTGLRQPIYAGRLAEVFLFFIKKDLHSKFMNLTKSTIEVGGDKTINYKQIIISIKNSSSFLDLAKYVFIITVPNRVFYFLFSPVIIFSPKLYEAILRISSDLSGYIKSKDIDRAAIIANAAAAVVVGKQGTAFATFEEINLLLEGDK